MVPPWGRPDSVADFCGPYGKRRVGLAVVARRFLLLLVQPVKLTAEVVKVLARFGKAVNLQELEPEPFGLFGLLNKQLSYVRRGHVHLPFLDGLRRSRWARLFRRACLAS